MRRQSQKHKATGTTTIKKSVGINHTLVEGVGNLMMFIFYQRKEDMCWGR